MTIHTITVPRPSPRLLTNALVALVLAVLGASVFGSLLHGDSSAETPRVMPQSAALEEATGVRFSRVAVVGDGGLVTVYYVVLDVEKATAFQENQLHPPTLVSENRSGSIDRVANMKPGHLVLAGKTYYLVYQNSGGTLRAGETATIRYGRFSLRQVPVL
jgi:hypothetical protein